MSRRLTRLIIKAVAAATVLLLCACSSTAQLSKPPDPNGAAIEEVVAPETIETLDTKPSKVRTGSPSTMAEVVPRGASDTIATAAEEAFVAVTPASPPAASVRARHAAEFGPGVTDGAIRIGAPLPHRDDKVNEMIYPETFRPEFERVWRVVADAINATGGILGRRLEVVFLRDAPTGDEICTFFTEEEPVIAVAGYEDGQGPCLDKAGIVPLPAAYSLEADYYRNAPHALAPMGISEWRVTQLYVEGLYQQGFFEGDHKIGLLRWDTPPYPALSNKIVKPTLARYGLELEEEVVLTYPHTIGAIPRAQAEARSGVQTFKRAGVDRLLTLDEGSYILPEFTDYAEAQDYRPRYGLNSFNGGEWNMERKQLKGAMGIGWMPWLDLQPDHAYHYGSDGGRRCRDLMAAAEEGQQMDTFNEAIWTSTICDAALLLKAAVEAGGPSITSDSIVAGAESLGTSFPSANTLLTRFGPGRHEGIAAIRFLRWFVGCQCFRYTSDLLDAG